MKTQYSYSRLNTYSQCPWAYKTIYLDKIPRTKTEAMEVGTLLHRLIRDYLTRLITYREATDWDWARGATPMTSHTDAAEIWEQFYSTFTLPPALDAPGVERELAFDRNWEPCEFYSEEAYFRMVIDFHFKQDGLGVIVDWKTNRIMPQAVDKDLQLRTYGWGLKRTLYPDVREVLLRLHFLRYGKEMEVLLSPEDLDGVPEELRARIEVIEADQTFSPTPGSFCGICGVTAHCPVMSQALAPIEILAPATREQAEKAASLLLTIRQMEKELAARLKEWVKENGPVQVGDLTYGPTTVTSYDLDAKAVVELLLRKGLDREAIWPMLGITKTSLERVLKKLKRQELIEEVLGQFPVNMTERIEFTKAKK